MNLGERVKTGMRMVGLSAPQLARKTGVAVSTINAMFRRDGDRSSFLDQLLTAFPPHLVNHDWVRTGQGTPEPMNQTEQTTERGSQQQGTTGQSAGAAAGAGAVPLKSWEHPEELPPGAAWVFVPKLGFRPPTDEGATNEIRTVLLTDETQAFRSEWIRQGGLPPQALAWHTAQDASMEPFVCLGDVFVTDTSSTKLVDGKTFAFWYGDDLRLRRVLLLPTGGVRLVAANPDFHPVDVPAPDLATLRVIGRVVHRAGTGGL